MDENRRYVIQQAIGEVCQTLIKLALIIAIALVVAKARSAEPPLLTSRPPSEARVRPLLLNPYDDVAVFGKSGTCDCQSKPCGDANCQAHGGGGSCECKKEATKPEPVRQVEVSRSPWPPQAYVGPPVARGNSGVCPGGVCPPVYPRGLRASSVPAAPPKR